MWLAVMSYSDPYVWPLCNVLFRPLCMAVMSYSDQTLMYGSNGCNVLFRPLMYGCNVIFRPLCMAVMSYMHGPIQTNVCNIQTLAVMTIFRLIQTYVWL